MSRRLALLVAVAAGAFSVPAADAPHASRDVREAEVRESTRGAAALRAAAWGIGEHDVLRYEELMAGRRGIWSPGADPLLVLGAHARTADERRRFAEAFVRAERARVDGELAFERAVQAAWARLYPGEPRVGGAAGAEGVPTRFAVVVGRDCRECGALVRRYSGRGAPVDFYVAGAAGDDDLRAWVREHGVDAAAIGAGRVTVNHGRGGVDAARVPSAWARDGAGRWEALE